MSAVQHISSAASAAMPRTIFDYDVLDVIGQGAGSEIYLVNHHESRQIYALKHVLRKSEKHARFVEQLENEFEVGQHVKHDTVRRVVDMKLTKSLLRTTTEAALVMELFDGTPLDQQKMHNLLKLVGCFIATAKALHAIHLAGYVHCDLKPNNILLSSDGVTKVIDLGQACPIGTKKERIQGTPDYISPEQVRCEPVTPKTDVFNFGATMYWCLTGRKMPTLFTLKKTENSFLVDGKIDSPSGINPNVPETLSNLVMECARTNATKRPGNVAELVSRLEIIEHCVRRDRTTWKKAGAA